MKNWEKFTRTTGIYRILNKKTNISYIGSSKDIAGRWKSHLYQLRIKKHHCSYLQNSFNIHGFQDFSFEVVEVCKQEELSYREWANWIVEEMIFGTFNSSPVNPFGINSLITDETKQKLSAARKSRIITEEQKEKTSATMKGRKHTTEAKENISAAKTGKKRKPFTEEHKERMRLSCAKRKEKKKLEKNTFELPAN